VQILGVSALEGHGADELMPAVMDMHRKWNLRVPTSRLNRWVEEVCVCVCVCFECMHGLGWGKRQGDMSVGQSAA
jgi:hypothetical protein